MQYFPNSRMNSEAYNVAKVVSCEMEAAGLILGMKKKMGHKTENGRYIWEQM